MLPWVIHLLNAALLALIFVGVPFGASYSIGPYSLHARHDAQRLMLACLLASATANGLARWRLHRRAKMAPGRKTLLEWSILHLALALLLGLHMQDLIPLDWLKDLLRHLHRTTRQL